MLKALSGKFIYRFFRWYIGFIIKQDFQKLHYNTVELNPGKAILLLSNHISWWDGFLLFYLNRIYLKKKFHVMVSEENYRKVKFLKYLGAFPLKKNSRNTLKTLQHAATLLNDAENLVVVFPQGKLFSDYQDEIGFEKGVSKLISYSNKKFQYLFVSIFVDYFEHRKPSVFLSLKKLESAEAENFQEIKTGYQKHYENSRRQHIRHTV